MKKILNFIVIIAISILCILPIHANARTIKIGFYIENEEALKSTQYSAYALSYLKKLFKYIDDDMEFSYCLQDECSANLADGKLDFVMNVPRSFSENKGITILNHKQSFRHTSIYVKDIYAYFNYADLLEIPNAIFGIIDNSVQQTDFLNYLKITSNSPTIKTYNSLSEMQLALDEGAISGFIYGDLPKDYDEYYCVTHIKTEAVFFATTLSNKYIDVFSKALETFKIENEDFEKTLYDKHFVIQNNLTTNLDQDELNYIKRVKSVKIAIHPQYYPLEAIERGKMIGITQYVLDMITKKTGLEFTLVPTSTYAESIDLFNKGKVDIVSGSIFQLSRLLRTSYVSKTYLTIPIISYYNINSMNTKIDNVALLAAFDYAQEYVYANHQGITITKYESPDECMSAVEKGIVDIVSMNQYAAENIINKQKYKNIESMTYTEYLDERAFAIAKDSPYLYSIIAKSLNQISKDDIQQAVYQNTLSDNLALSLSAFIKRYPFVVIGSIVMIALVIMAVLLLLIKQKNRFNGYISEIAYKDETTGFGNYQFFKKEARKKLNRAQANMHYIIVSLNISKLHNVSILIGANESDTLIKEVASIINDTLSNEEAFGRLTKDEFNILKRFENYEDISNWMLVMQYRVDAYLEKNNVRTRVYLNAGIFEIMDFKSNIADALEKSDYALKSIEENTELKYTFYDFRLNDQILLVNKIESMMENAITSGEFQVYLQPKFSLLSNNVIGAEALIRWDSESEGLLYPNQFIPLFEKNGFIKKLDYYVYEIVLKYLSTYGVHHKTMIPISFNLSRIHLHNNQLVDDLVNMAQKYNVDPKYIEIELTETAFIERTQDIIESMQKLKDKGFRIAMDDFGTGYSSLNLLKDMPLDIVKIDKSFLSKESVLGNDRIVLQSIVSMAKLLGLEVICEGVETKEQAAFLRLVNCFQAQGYLYSKALSIQEFDLLMVKNESAG